MQWWYGRTRGGGDCICLHSLTNCGTRFLFYKSRSNISAVTMCEVTCEDLSSSGNSSTLLISNDDDSQWVACGRKLRQNNTSRLNEEEEFRQNNSAMFIDLPLELCDPMRRKITSLKPSLTPGAGTRIVRRKKRESFNRAYSLYYFHIYYMISELYIVRND